MSNIKTTTKKECPYCGSKNILYKGAVSIMTTRPQKKYFTCREINCKKIFEYTGKM